MKTCSSCNITKPLTEFYADKRRPDGKQSHCKTCKAARYGEAARERARQWYVDNPERHKETSRRLRSANREHYLAQTREYSAARVGNRDSNKPWPTGHCTYSAAHLRLKHARGRASDQACVDCGNPARDWSYNGSSALELTETRPMPRGRNRVVSYSCDPSDYAPRCKRDHAIYDASRSRELVAA